MNALNLIGTEHIQIDKYVSKFLKKKGWYLVVIGKLHNDECIIYIFTGKVQNGTPIIFKECLNTVSI